MKHEGAPSLCGLGQRVGERQSQTRSPRGLTVFRNSVAPSLSSRVEAADSFANQPAQSRACPELVEGDRYPLDTKRRLQEVSEKRTPLHRNCKATNAGSLDSRFPRKRDAPSLGMTIMRVGGGAREMLRP